MSAPPNEASERYELQVQEAIRFAGRDHSFFLEAKARALLDLADRRLRTGAPIRALDVGCGDGRFDALLAPLDELHGVDVSPAMVAIAGKRVSKAHFEVADGTRLPFPDDSYDLTFSVCTLHHISPERRHTFVHELKRVTRKGGLVVVFEHNPLNPLTRLVVRRCAFDHDVMLVSRRDLCRLVREVGLTPEETRYLLFFPWRGTPFTQLERALAPVPAGAQYVVASRA